MTDRQEHRDFSARLLHALSRAGYTDSPTKLCRAYNSKTMGISHPLTIHACRKWIIGEAIPTQEKIKVLSDFLNVDPSWLRFGTENRVLNPLQIELLRAVDNLNAEQKNQVLALAHGLEAKGFL